MAPQGQVTAVDGHGVVLHSEDFEHAVIRMGQRVRGPRLRTAVPTALPITTGAQPMPQTAGQS